MKKSLICYERIKEIYKQQNIKHNDMYFKSLSQIGKIYGHLGMTDEAISILKSIITNKSNVEKST